MAIFQVTVTYLEAGVAKQFVLANTAGGLIPLTRDYPEGTPIPGTKEEVAIDIAQDGLGLTSLPEGATVTEIARFITDEGDVGRRCFQINLGELTAVQKAALIRDMKLKAEVAVAYSLPLEAIRPTKALIDQSAFPGGPNLAAETAFTRVSAELAPLLQVQQAAQTAQQTAQAAVEAAQQSLAGANQKKLAIAEAINISATYTQAQAAVTPLKAAEDQALGEYLRAVDLLSPALPFPERAAFETANQGYVQAIAAYQSAQRAFKTAVDSNAVTPDLSADLLTSAVNLAAAKQGRDAALDILKGGAEARANMPPLPSAPGAAAAAAAAEDPAAIRTRLGESLAALQAAKATHEAAVTHRQQQATVDRGVGGTVAQHSGYMVVQQEVAAAERVLASAEAALQREAAALTQANAAAAAKQREVDTANAARGMLLPAGTPPAGMADADQKTAREAAEKALTEEYVAQIALEKKRDTVARGDQARPTAEAKRREAVAKALIKAEDEEAAARELLVEAYTAGDRVVTEFATTKEEGVYPARALDERATSLATVNLDKLARELKAARELEFQALAVLATDAQLAEARERFNERFERINVLGPRAARPHDDRHDYRRQLIEANSLSLTTDEQQRIYRLVEAEVKAEQTAQLQRRELFASLDYNPAAAMTAVTAQQREDIQTWSQAFTTHATGDLELVYKNDQGDAVTHQLAAADRAAYLTTDGSPDSAKLGELWQRIAQEQAEKRLLREAYLSSQKQQQIAVWEQALQPRPTEATISLQYTEANGAKAPMVVTVNDLFTAAGTLDPQALERLWNGVPKTAANERATHLADLARLDFSQERDRVTFSGREGPVAQVGRFATLFPSLQSGIATQITRDLESEAGGERIRRAAQIRYSSGLSVTPELISAGRERAQAEVNKELGDLSAAVQGIKQKILADATAASANLRNLPAAQREQVLEKIVKAQILAHRDLVDRTTDPISISDAHQTELVAAVIEQYSSAALAEQLAEMKRTWIERARADNAILPLSDVFQPRPSAPPAAAVAPAAGDGGAASPPAAAPLAGEAAIAIRTANGELITTVAELESYWERHVQADALSQIVASRAETGLAARTEERVSQVVETAVSSIKQARLLCALKEGEYLEAQAAKTTLSDAEFQAWLNVQRAKEAIFSSLFNPDAHFNKEGVLVDSKGNNIVDKLLRTFVKPMTKQQLATLKEGVQSLRESDSPADFLIYLLSNLMVRVITAAKGDIDIKNFRIGRSLDSMLEADVRVAHDRSTSGREGTLETKLKEIVSKSMKKNDKGEYEVDLTHLAKYKLGNRPGGEVEEKVLVAATLLALESGIKPENIKGVSADVKAKAQELFIITAEKALGARTRGEIATSIQQAEAAEAQRRGAGIKQGGGGGTGGGGAAPSAAPDAGEEGGLDPEMFRRMMGGGGG